jgi:hypothetical protein
MEMNSEPAPPRLFSTRLRIAILYFLLVGAGTGFASCLAWQQTKSQVKKRQSAHDMHGIFTALLAWAADHDQAFPDLPDHANINFRELFKSGLVTSEDMFAVPGDGWCLPGKPDHDTGTAPDFAKALEPGEQSTGYVAGLETASNSLLPLVFYQPSPGQEVQRWISVTGSAKIAPFSPKSLGQDWDELQKQLRLPALPAKP